VKWRVESGAQRILPSDLPINTLQSKPGQAQAAQRHRAKRSAFELPSEPSKLDALKYFNDLTSPLHLLPPSRFVSLCCVSSPNSLPRYQFASLQVLTYHSSPLHVLLSLKVDHTSISPLDLSFPNLTPPKQIATKRLSKTLAHHGAHQLPHGPLPRPPHLRQHRPIQHRSLALRANCSTPSTRSFSPRPRPQQAWSLRARRLCHCRADKRPYAGSLLCKCHGGDSGSGFGAADRYGEFGCLGSCCGGCAVLEC